MILSARRLACAKQDPSFGINMTDFSALQEMDDLEYVERMKRLK
jgi:hypothetical protein